MNLELIRGPKEWWHNTEELAEFAEWMVDTTRSTSWKPVVAKPWHFDAAYREYQREQILERYADEMAALEDHRRGPTSDEAA